MASEPEANACQACQSGQFQDQSAQATCKVCAAGKFRTNVEASEPEANACKNCSVNTFQDQVAQTSCKNCNTTKPGFVSFQDQEGQTSCKEVEKIACSKGCALGFFCEYGTGAAPDLCEQCPAGRASNVVFMVVASIN